MRTPIYKQENNRWTWEVHGTPRLSGEDHILQSSVVSFPDEATARHDYEIRQFSRRIDCRWQITQTELNNLLMYAAQMSDACNFSGHVVRSIPTADGRNWDIAWGSTDRRSKDLMSNAVTKIREKYNLIES